MSPYLRVQATPFAFSVLVLLTSLSGCTEPETAPLRQPLAVSPTTLDYGALVVGHSADSTVRLENQGNDTVRIFSTATASAAFSIIEDSVLWSNIPPLEHRDVRVRFAPRDSIAYSSSDTLNVSGHVLSFVTSGRGIRKNVRLGGSPDLLDFGDVRMGFSHDAIFQVTNLGEDLIAFGSNHSSNHAFSLLRAVSSLAPDSTAAFIFRYTPTDTGEQAGIDTLTFDGKTVLVMMRGRGTAYSELFPIPPRSVDIRLTGIVGSADSTHPFTFDFSANFNPTGSYARHLSFYTHTDRVVGTNQGGTPRMFEGITNEVMIVLDSTSRIDSLTAWYDYGISSPWPSSNYTKHETLMCHSLPLSAESRWLSCTRSADELATVVDQLTYSCYGPPVGGSECVYPEWSGFVRFRSDATLSMWIIK